MSNDLVHRCCICEADFRPGTLDENGKCSSCRVEYPTVKNKTEAMALNRPEIHLNKKLDAEDVRQIVREELNAFESKQKMAEIAKARNAEEKADRMAKARAAKQDKTNDNNGDE